MDLNNFHDSFLILKYDLGNPWLEQSGQHVWRDIARNVLVLRLSLLELFHDVLEGRRFRDDRLHKVLCVLHHSRSLIDRNGLGLLL